MFRKPTPETLKAGYLTQRVSRCSVCIKRGYVIDRPEPPVALNRAPTSDYRPYRPPPPYQPPAYPGNYRQLSRTNTRQNQRWQAGNYRRRRPQRQ